MSAEPPRTPAPALLLVRHGETSANLDGVWHGSIDTPLTPRGLAQAERVAAFLARDCADACAVYTSDLQRARRTAEAIARALSLEPRVEPGLREYDLGSWEGKAYRVLHEEHRLWHRMRADPDFAPHGGESPLGVTRRLTDTLRRIGAEHAEGRAIVVSHGGALSLALAALVEGHYTAWGRVMDNCAVSELRLAPAPSLSRFNLVAHLEGV